MLAAEFADAVVEMQARPSPINVIYLTDICPNDIGNLLNAVAFVFNQFWLISVRLSDDEHCSRLAFCFTHNVFFVKILARLVG